MAENSAAGKSAVTNSSWILPFIGALLAMVALQINNLGFSPLMPSIQKTWNLSNSQVGLFTGINGILSLIMAVPAGILVQKFGAKKVCTTGMVITAIGLAIVALSNNFAMGMFGRVVWQAGYKGTFIAVIAAVAMATPAKLRSSSFGINGSLSALSVVLGSSIGTSLAKAYGWQGGIWSYVFIVIIGILIFSVLYKVAPQAAGAKVDAHGHPVGGSSSANSRSAYKTPMVWLMALLMMTGSMIGISLTFFMPSMLVQVYKYTPPQIAAVLSTGYGIGVVVILAMGYFSDRLKNGLRVILGGIFCINILAGLLMTIHNVTAFKTGVTIVLCLGLAIPNFIYAATSKVMEGRDVGNAVGVVGLGMGAGAYFGPQMLGILRDVSGSFTSGLYFLVAMSIVSLIIVIALKFDKVVEVRQDLLNNFQKS